MRYESEKRGKHFFLPPILFPFYFHVRSSPLKWIAAMIMMTIRNCTQIYIDWRLMKLKLLNLTSLLLDPNVSDECVYINSRKLIHWNEWKSKSHGKFIVVHWLLSFHLHNLFIFYVNSFFFSLRHMATTLMSSTRMQFRVNKKINHLSINQNVECIKFVPFQCANLKGRERKFIRMHWCSQCW